MISPRSAIRVTCTFVDGSANLITDCTVSSLFCLRGSITIVAIVIISIIVITAMLISTIGIVVFIFTLIVIIRIAIVIVVFIITQ